MSTPPTLTLPPCARAYQLETGRGRFAVHDARPSGPVRGTALLVPGFTGSKEDFIALLEPLAGTGFRVVAVDGRGQWESEGPRDPDAYAQGALARDVLAQAAALAGDAGAAGRRVHVLGHSLGGLIVRDAVLRDAAPFASVTLMSSGPAAISESQQARTRMLLDALAVLDMESIWQAMRDLDPPEAPEAGASAEVREFLHRRWLSTVPEQLTATGRQLLQEPDRVDELAAVALPKHVLSGDNDYAWPVARMDAMAVRLSARRSVIAGAGHSPNAEQPSATARELSAFWLDVGDA